MDVVFFANSLLLGVGLAMDAFSVSLANGLNEPEMKPKRMTLIAGIFGIFQGLMPLLGWIFVHTLLSVFSAFEKFIPWIALALLSYIGIKMVIEGIKQRGETDINYCPIGLRALLVQGLATSIDALSVGFTIASYDLLAATLSSLIIAAVTFAICYLGLYIGKKAGTKLSFGAGILGGSILILIGLEIFITSFF